MRSLTILLALALAAGHVQAKPALTAKQKTEVRREIRSLMNYHFNLFGGRRPALATTFTPLGKDKVRVDATMTSRWVRGREPQERRFGIIKLLGGGKWTFAKSKSNSYYQLETPTSASRSVFEREAPVGRAVVVRKTGSTSWVLYDRPNMGSELRLARLDGKQKIRAKSVNLAPKVMSAALDVHRKGQRGTRSWGHLGNLAENGRSITVKVYTGLPNFNAHSRDEYRVGLDDRGAPTGEVKHLEHASW